MKYIKRNFVPGRRFRDLDDFNASCACQLRAWLSEIADVRIHGAMHQRPLGRFAADAPALLDVTGHPSFVQAMVRERVVAEDWLVSVDSNRYSVPCRLIGKRSRWCAAAVAEAVDQQLRSDVVHQRGWPCWPGLLGVCRYNPIDARVRLCVGGTEDCSALLLAARHPS